MIYKVYADVVKATKNKKLKDLSSILTLFIRRMCLKYNKGVYIYIIISYLTFFATNYSPCTYAPASHQLD